jgi:hypothetical protein
MRVKRRRERRGMESKWEERERRGMESKWEEREEGYGEHMGVKKW